MGGSVNITVREKNGKVTRMCRWTNNLNYWFQTPEFRENSAEVLEKYIKAGEDSEFNYGDATLSPDGYGLIVIDDIHKVILSHQNYTDVSMYHGIRMLNDLHISDCFDKKSKDSIVPFINIEKLKKHQLKQKKYFGDLSNFSQKNIEEELKDMKKHYDLFMSSSIQLNKQILLNMEKRENKKWIKSFEYRRYIAIGKILEKKNKTNKDWLDFILYNRSFLSCTMFYLDLGGYEFINFDKEGDTITEYALFLDKIHELGFKLTKKDQADWEKYLSDYSDEY